MSPAPRPVPPALPLLVSLLMAVTVLPALAAGSAAAAAPAAATAAPAAAGGRNYTPPNGVVLSDPMIASRRRVVLARIIRSINNPRRGETIRTAVWNYDDRATTNAYLAAHRRGVNVQIVTANSTRNGNWNRTVKALGSRRGNGSFAIRCKGGCRSAAILHSKFVLFTKVGSKARNVVMLGSFNLTTAAGNRQWNDLVTQRNKRFHDNLVRTFNQYARDRNVQRPFQRSVVGKRTITLWPGFKRNTIRGELNKVRCNPPGGYAGRTKVRIAIAGWFDQFGTQIARRVRQLWKQGCDIKIITTLAGRGVNQTLRNAGPRGPVPIRRVAIDNNRDGVPERYLHMKAIAIKGGFGDDPRADVLITGSPNWSSRANRSDEIIFRFRDVPGYVGRYVSHVDRLFGGPHTLGRTAVDLVSPEQDAAVGTAGRRLAVPDWYELN